MANLNENQSGVFGGVNMDENVDYTSYFDNLNQNVENVTEDNNGIFENNQSNYYSNSYNGTNNVNNAGVFGGVDFTNGKENEPAKSNNIFQPIGKDKAITKQGLWTKIRSFLFQEIDLNSQIKVELTPRQQKIEDEINAFLHQEVTFKGITNLFKGKK